jgi:hypothetical protein
MPATLKIRQEWIERGKEQKATHLFVVCDTFSYEDYPVFVNGMREYAEAYKRYNMVNMQRIMEVIDLSKEQ